MSRQLLQAYAALFLILVLSACGTPQKSIYFNNSDPMDSVGAFSMATPQIPETIIRPDDILAVTITSTSSIREDQDPVNIFREGGTPYSLSASSTSSGGTAATGGSNLATRLGYLVDHEGYIDFPVVGKMHVADLNMRQAKELFSQKLNKIIKDPVVEVRILNYKVVVLGEVQNPGTVIAPNHTINILEAIAASGDILITGSRENVLVIRQEDRERKFIRMNLNSREVFQSPYFYLRQNDVVYIEPNKIRRQQNNEFLRLYVPAISSVVSTIVAVYGIVKISQK